MTTVIHEHRIRYSVSSTHYFYRTIPGAGSKSILCDKIPVHGKYLPLVFLPRSYRKFVDRNVKQLDRAVSTTHDYLILVGLGPGSIV